MRDLYFLALASLITVANADSVLRVSSHLALNNRFGVSPLLQRAELVHRVRRQTHALLGPRAPEQCVLDCVETMEEKLVEAFPEVANFTQSSKDDIQEAILSNDYDPAKFVKFCDIYGPSGRCLHLCPKSYLKSLTEKSLAMVEYMCVDRYDEFKKYGACMEKAGKEIDDVCTPQCSAFEKGVEKLENLTKEDSYEEYDDLDLSDLLNQSCSFVACLMQCDQPIMAKKCGRAAPDLEQETISIAFSSLNDLLASSSEADLWPESCAKLAMKHINGKPSTPNPTKEEVVHFGEEAVRDDDD